MKKLSNFFSLIILISNLFFYSCSNKKNEELSFNENSFKEVVHMPEGRKYINNNLLLGDPRWIRFHPDSFLIIQEIGTSNLVTIIDLKTDDIQKLIPIGKGPGELISAWGTEIFNGESFTYSRPMGKIIKYAPDHNRKFQIIDEFRFQGMEPMDVIPLKSNCFVSLSSMDSDKRLTFYDEKGKIIKQMGDFPAFVSKNGKKGDNDIFGSYMTSKPKGDKILLACAYTDILEIYDAENGLVKRIHGPLGVQLEVNTINIGVGTMSRREPSVLTYCKVEANEHEFWVGYIGYKQNKVSGPKLSDVFPKRIFCFNWDGKPLRIIEFNSFIFAFDIDWKGNRMYTVELNESSEPIIVSYNLTDILQ
jgi:hypothetical protein